MSVRHRELLKDIRTFPSLVKYLRDELDWPIQTHDFEELTFDYTAEELGIDSKSAAKIQEIKRLRPLSANQPWGIFFVKFEPKGLPVVALRRILSRVVVKKRASANSAERAAWEAEDLLFVSNYGEGEERKISLAHFTQDRAKNDLPTLKVLGWDNLDTALHLDHVAEELHEKLTWPEDENDIEAWRKTWRSAFTLRHREVITTSKVLAIKLAELARDIRARIKTVLTIETENGPVRKLMKAFQEALIHDLDEDGFADMYAQTITYGLLSARITDPKGDSPDDLAKHMPVTNPFLKELMETFLFMERREKEEENDTRIDFDEIGVNEVVELLDDANMEAVVLDFGDRNPQEDPVIHFYEFFLKEYDAKKRTQRGVFYTPRPVVSYIVRSVDKILRTEFSLEDGLADTTTWGEMAEQREDLEIPYGAKPEDPFVQILDPATGTGTFLVEVIDLIHKTLTKKWSDEGHRDLKITQLWNEYVPKHLLPRLHGYELLMAPYAIAHMKIGLKLYETGYRFCSDERAHIYLTNSLESALEDDKQRSFVGWLPALAHEAKTVNEIKRLQRFTVVIGNPPYSNYGQLNKTPFILELLEDYKRNLEEKKINIDDDFIKFFRFGQWLIEQTGQGIFAFISNNTYIDGITHRRMRESLIETFNTIYVLDLHGSGMKKETAPDGSKDENVFDIQQGVCIGIFLKYSGAISASNEGVFHRDLWGLRQKKYKKLLTGSVTSMPWGMLKPTPKYLFLVPINLDFQDEYMTFTPIVNIFLRYTTGIDTKIDRILIDEDAKCLQDRLAVVLNPKLSIPEVKQQFDIPETSTWEIKRAKTASFNPAKVTRVLYRPFDWRYTYYDEKVLSRARIRIMDHFVASKNLGLCFMRQYSYHCDYCYFLATEDIVESRIFISNRGRAQVLPLYLYQIDKDDVDGRIPNISAESIAAFERNLGIDFVVTSEGDLKSNFGPEDIFHYIYAVFHSPEYRKRYAEFLKIDFPHLPLTSSLDLFRSLAILGSELVSLHVMKSPRLDNFITTLAGSGEFQLEKISYSDSTVWFDKAKTCGFQGIPENVWNFHIGGYQVCEKWLKDRQTKGGKNPRPGRVLADEDLVHYQKIVVAINETIRIMKEIDEVIDKHGGWPDAFTIEDN